MAKPVSISLSKFTTSVQAAVKAAVAKHPKFSVEVPNAVSVAYLIRGIPVPEAIAAKATLAETQAFATDVATHLAQAHPEAFAASPSAHLGAVYSFGGHIILGIPAPPEFVQLEK
jgi:hypothetical protein